MTQVFMTDILNNGPGVGGWQQCRVGGCLYTHIDMSMFSFTLYLNAKYGFMATALLLKLEN